MKLFNGFVLRVSQLSSRDLCYIDFFAYLCQSKIIMLTTPGGVEHNEGIFVRIEYGGLEVGSH
jgi:hypothetical protein